MTIRWIVAAVHLLGLGIGLGAIFARARALRGSLDREGLRRVFVADNFWGVSALLLIGTGIPRAFSGLEKGTVYYVTQPMFHAKMGLLLLVLMLEVWPMITLIRWRVRVRRSQPIDRAPARLMAWISDGQTVLVVLMVLAATALARGIRP